MSGRDTTGCGKTFHVGIGKRNMRLQSTHLGVVMAQPEPLYSPPQLAERLQIPEKTLNEWRYKRIGPRYLKIGKHVRYRLADVDEWLRRQLVASRTA